MREDNLPVMRKRRFITTTGWRHTRTVCPNLARDLTLTGPNQLWVADITYIRLRETFLCRAAILDAWSRRVVGWEPGETLQAGLAVAAKEAL